MATLKVAAVQAAPVFLDRSAPIEKTVSSHRRSWWARGPHYWVSRRLYSSSSLLIPF